MSLICPNCETEVEFDDDGMPEKRRPVDWTVRETAYPPSPGTSYEGILQSGGSETEPSDSEEPGVYNNRRHVLSLNKLVFGNPYGTPQ